MAPPPKKRKTRAAAKAEEEELNRQQEEDTRAQQSHEQETTEEITEVPQDAIPEADATAAVATDNAEPKKEMSSANEDKATKAQDRMARFKALQARAKNSAETNMKEATLESQRLATDPSQLKTLQRQTAIASHKLLKAEVEEDGGDFERKRAWDWTVDESEKWDKRLKKRATARDNNAFQDNQQESNKVYKRQLRNINPDMEKYEKDKMALIEKSAASGGLDLVETEDGEVIAIDKDGSFYSTADSITFAQNKPDKAAVDRLVKDLQRAEEQRLKKRKERMAQNGDEGDVTFINEKNKQFNQKLARFYDKYTVDIRDSFDRGTRI
jgi:pre-mRNA-splicing factor SYF2